MKLSRLATPSLVLALALGLPARAHAQDSQDSKNSKQGQDSKQDASSPEKLVADLGADDYQTREDAQKKLVALGRRALPALEKAEKESKDAEVRARAHEAIAAIGKSAPESAPGREKKGELEPGEPRVEEDPDEPRTLRPPRLPDMFRGGRDMDGEMPEFMKKMLEQIQKQFEGMDRDFQRELQPGKNGPQIFRFQTVNRPRSSIEAKLGVTLVPPAPVLAAQLDLKPESGGLVIDELTPNQPAWKVGLQRYDVVLSVDGKPVRNPGDLAGLGEREAKVEVLRKAQKTVVLVHKLEASEATPGGDKTKPIVPEKPDAPRAEEPARKF